MFGGDILFYEKNKIYIVLALICMIIIGVIYTLFRDTNNKYLVNGNNSNPNIVLNTQPSNILREPNMDYGQGVNKYRVFISGEVINPDVYEVDSNFRIVDLLKLAGGPTENADLNRINLAEFLSDAQHIIIPAILEVGSQEYLVSVAENNHTQNSHSNLVNINTASLNELMALPGVGTVISQNIINYREQNGPFSTIEELKRVNRIGINTFENLRDLITI